MNHEIRFDLTPADPSNFSGTAFTRMIASADESAPVKLFYVRFEPGARTYWHAHAGRQTLVVTSGRCDYQVEGREVRQLASGESVIFEEGVRHWHGASTNEAAEHIAINMGVLQTDWFEEVTME